jgi:hypothetical protein
MLRPIGFSAGSPRGPDDFRVGWASLVTGREVLASSFSPYLEAIAAYSNNDGPPGGILAVRYRLADDREFARLLPWVNQRWGGFEDGFVPLLLPQLHPQGTLASSFRWLSPFLLAGELARYAYTYGMYKWFYQDHTPGEAVLLAGQLTEVITGGDLGQVVCFQSQDKWCDWFDEHSCSDRSFLVVQARERLAWLLCFSHSD